MKLNDSTLGIGMGAGLVAAIYAIGVASRYGYPPLQRLALPIFGMLGFACTMHMALELQRRCELFQHLLRKHGIDPEAPE
jgi:hypothetical protein